MDARYLRITLSSAQRLLQSDRVTNLVVGLDGTKHRSGRRRADPRLRGLPQQMTLKKWIDLAAYYKQVRTLFDGIFLFMGVIVFFMVLMSSVNSLLMAMFERTREIGTMLAMGTPRAWIMALFMVEATLIGILGAAAGVVGGNLLGVLFKLPACTCRRRPATLSTCLSASTRAQPDDRLFASGDRLAGIGVHSSRGPRIAAANRGGAGPCLRSISFSGRSCCFFSIRFLCTCALVCYARRCHNAGCRSLAQALRRVPQRLALLCDAGQDHRLRSGKPDEEHLYEVSQKGTEKTYVEFLSPREKGRAPAHAGRRYVGLSARHQPPGAHYAARTADRRRIERRRGAHQLRRRLLARLPAH